MINELDRIFISKAVVRLKISVHTKERIVPSGNDGK